MKKHLLIFLLLATLAPWAVQAQTKTHIASTSSSTQMTWAEFAQNVNNGITYEGQTVYLDSNVTATTRAGYATNSDTKSFHGTFDGQGHTITFNFTADNTYAAPFACVKNATFLNLKTTGTITANTKRYAGGIAGMVISGSQSCTFTNCESNVTITSTSNGDADCRHGGFVANVVGGNVTFNGCAFTGGFSGTNAKGWGGFVGYFNHYVYFTDCIFSPTSISINNQNNSTFARPSGTQVVTFPNCYYTQSLGGSQGKQRYTVTAESPATVAMNGASTYHYLSHITAYEGNQGLVYNNAIVAGEGDNVSLNLGGGDFYMASPGTITGNGNPYTLAMDANNTIISIAKNHIASTSSDTQMTWAEFAQNVNNGTTYEGQTIYLDADVTATTMAGTNETNCFKGTFEGQGHTLTFNYTASGSYYTAPFHYLNGATIQNLKVSGTITANYARCGGLAGNCYGTNAIINCLSNITINSTVNGDGTHGGFISRVYRGTTTFEGCTFAGSLLGENTTANGGFVGWSEGNNNYAFVSFSNCVYAPVANTTDPSAGATFARGRNNSTTGITISNCFYTSSEFQYTQGKQAYTITSQSPVSMTMNGTATYHNVSRIKAYSSNPGLVYNGTVIAGEGDIVSLNLGDALSFSADHGTLTGTANPYTLSMEAYNTTISAVTPLELETITIGVPDPYAIETTLPGRYGYTYSVFIYQPEDSDFLNFDFDLSTLAFYLTRATSIPIAELTLWVKDVDADFLTIRYWTFSDYIDGATQVYDSQAAFAATTGWNTFNFSTTYSHEGGRALLIAVRSVGTNLAGSGSTNNWNSCSYTTNSRSHWCKYANNTDPGTAVDGEWNVDHTRADIQLGVTYTGATCFIPSDLTVAYPAGTDTEVTLGWTENGEATAWQICLNDDETNLIDADSNPFTLTGLTPETLYYAKVRANCGDLQSNWSSAAIMVPTLKTVIGMYDVIVTTDLPTNILANYSMTEQVYTTDELGEAGSISSIDFFNNATGTATRNLQIYMRHYDAVSPNPYGNWTSVTTNDLVFSGNVNFASKAWTSITLNTPFDYNGTQNVLVKIVDNTGSAGSGQFEFLCNTNPDQIRRARSISGDQMFDPTDQTSYQWAGSTTGRDYTRIAKEPYAHPVHFAVSDITGNSATLSWIDGGSAWQVALTDGYDYSTLYTPVMIEANSNPFTLTGLHGATIYHTKVRACYGPDEYSDWSDEVEFSTYMDIPHYCDFDSIYVKRSMYESALSDLGVDSLGTDTIMDFIINAYRSQANNGLRFPPRWGRFNEGGHPNFLMYSKWSFDSDLAYSGDGFLQLSITDYVASYTGYTGPSYATLRVDNPDVDMSSLGVEFLARADQNYFNNDYTSIFTVGVLNDDDTFFPIKTINPRYNDYKAYSFSLRNYTGNGNRIAFKIAYVEGVDNIAYIDNVVVKECPISEFPWIETFEDYTGPYDHWDYYDSLHSNFYCYSPACWENEVISGSSQPFMLSHHYKYDNYSNKLNIDFRYSGTTKLMLPMMDLPDDHYEFMLDVYRDEESGYDNDCIKVYASANGELTGATLLATINHHRNVSDGNHIPAESHAGWFTYSLPLGMSGPCYIILVAESQDSDATLKMFVDNFVVREMANCPEPVPTVAELTPYTATLTWADDMGQALWQLCVDGDETNLIDATNNTFTLTGLAPVSDHRAKVRALCSAGGYTYWSDEVYFTTNMDPADVPYSTDFEDGCDWRLVNGNSEGQWAYGTAGWLYGAPTGNHTLYISNDGGNTAGYNAYESSLAFATKPFNFTEAGHYLISYEYDYSEPYTNYETNHVHPYTYMRVAMVPNALASLPANVVPEGFDRNHLPEGWMALDGGTGLPINEHGFRYAEIFIAEPGTYVMMFVWRNIHNFSDSNPLAIDNVSITPEGCFRPSDLYADVTATTANLGWTENDESTAWQICLDDDETNLIEADTNPFMLTGLTEEVTRTFKVRSVCGDNSYSLWSESQTFRPTRKTVIGTAWTTRDLPICATHYPSQSQQIYTADELGNAGEILSIDYLCYHTVTRNLKIYMKHTNKSAFSSAGNSISYSDADLVYDGEVTFVRQDWTVITLQTPFAYNGQQNVVITVVDVTGDNAPSYANFWVFKAVHQTRVRYNNSWHLEDYKNHIRIDKRTQHTDITGYSTGTGNWRLIASPIATATTPADVVDMLSNEYDLYRFNPAVDLEWENWKDSITDHYHFNLESGRGYLYANNGDVTLSFFGVPYVDNGQVTLSKDEDAPLGEWNLIGNPYATAATIGDKPFYVMNDLGTEIIAAENDTIAAMEGIFVQANTNGETVTFTPVSTGAKRGESEKEIVLNLLDPSTGSTTASTTGSVIDRAIIRFGEGEALPKMQIRGNSSKVYIPQDGKEYAVACVGRDVSGNVSTTEIPVNFEAAEDGIYTLTVDTEGINLEYLHLIDNMTGTDIDLLAGCKDAPWHVSTAPTYTFTAKTTDDASRFRLVFSANGEEVRTQERVNR